MHDHRRRRIPISGFGRPESDPTTARPIRHRPTHAEGDGAQTPQVAEPAAGRAMQSDTAGARAEAVRAETARAEAARAEAARAEAARAEIERLSAELEAAKTQAAEHLTTLQRTAAEFQNYRRRTTEEREREAGLANDYLLKKALSIADDFDRAIEARPPELAGNSWAEGIAAIDRKLRGLLESEGVRPIEAVGKPFDPREHEAITSVPSTGRPDGEVIAEVQRGYRLRDRVLRPALVAVAASDRKSSPPAPTESTNPESGPERLTD
jgi:molecular chaperone GrpE